MQAYAEERRIALIQLGGRPTRAIQWDAGPCGFIEGIDDTSSGEEEDTQRESWWLLHHWSLEGANFAGEVNAWQNFRRFQQHIRTKPVPLRERRVEDYWNERGIREALKPQLRDDLEQQSKHTRSPRASTSHSSPLLSHVRNSKVSTATTNQSRPGAQLNHSQEHKQRDASNNNKAPKPSPGPARNRLTRSSGISKSAKARTPMTRRKLKEPSHSSGSARRREKLVAFQGVQVELPPLQTLTLRSSERLARKSSGGD
ncbi:MAG: hypothetical protein Q9193_005349 [Seirophora villosa]